MYKSTLLATYPLQAFRTITQNLFMLYISYLSNLYFDKEEDDNMETKKILIHGSWKESSSDDCLDIINPSTGMLVTRIPKCNKNDVDQAVQSASVGFNIWKNTSSEDRAKIMHKAAGLIRENSNKIANEISSEMGKPSKSALGEVLGAATLFDFFAEEGLRLKGDIYLRNYSDEQVQVLKEPIGIVAGITAANYPVALLTWKLGAALAAGCSFVAKPDVQATSAALSIGEIFLKAGLPNGVFNIVAGDGTTGSLLVKHSLISKVAVTGSVETGSKVAALAARDGKRITLELGGQCPAIITEGIDPRKIIKEFISQTFNNSGQYCYGIHRAYVHSSIYDSFIDVLVENVKKLKVGVADDPSVDLGPLYRESIYNNVMKHIEDAIAKGARVLCGGRRLESPTNTYFVEPTVLDNVSGDMLISKEETFGPVLAVIKVDSLSEAIEYANNTMYGLASFVYTSDAGLGLQAARQLESGVVWVNKIHKAYDYAPFGGFKRSGMGREKSSYGLDEYLELKTIYLTLPTID